jgi:hypothetical protein
MADFIFYFITMFLLLNTIYGLLLVKKNQNDKNFKKHIAEFIRPVRQEQYGDCYYWFDSENEKFLAQGKTYIEIRETLRARFPRHVFLIGNNKMMVGPNFEVLDINHENLKKLEI